MAETRINSLGRQVAARIRIVDRSGIEGGVRGTLSCIFPGPGPGAASGKHARHQAG